VKITDRIPPFKRAKSLWSTRSRRPEELAIAAGRAAGAQRFNIGVNQFYRNTQRMRETFTRFTTTPDWEARRALGASAHELLK
jgi:hypothetical protein